MKGNSRLSIVITLILSLFIGCLTFFKGPERVLGYDVFGYYLYLPATFIYDDPAIEQEEWVDDLFKNYNVSNTFYQASPTGDGQRVIQYTSGMAILFSPFFFIAHWLAELLGYAADGLSPPYQKSLIIGSFLYVVLGLFFLRSALRKLFSDVVTSVTLIILVLGTNYLVYAYGNSLVQHIYLFSLYSLLLWLTIKWHSSKRKYLLVLIACTCGLMTLIRPTDVLSLLIPLLWGTSSWSQIKEKLGTLWKNRRKEVVLFLVVFAAWGLPQFLYWFYTTGTPLYVSYRNPAEGLEPWHPWIRQVLFSFENGWLIYSPLMMLGIVGLFLLRRYKAEVFLTVIVFSLANLWVVSSWSNWNYAGGFGHRAMIQSYPVWGIAIAGCLKAIFLTSKKWLKISTTALLLFFIVLSLFQQWQFYKGILLMDRMTASYYFRVFGRTEVHAADRELLLINRDFDGREVFSDEENYTEETMYFNDYEGEISKEKIKQNIENISGAGNVLRMDSTLRYSDGIKISYQDITNQDHAWLRGEVRVLFPSASAAGDAVFVSTFEHNGEVYKYSATTLNPEEVVAGEWRKIEFDYLTPRVRNLSDEYSVYLWYRGDEKVFIDDLKVMKYTLK